MVRNVKSTYICYGNFCSVQANGSCMKRVVSLYCVGGDEPLGLSM